MFSLIPLAISLATKFAPALIEKLVGEKAGSVAEKVIGLAQSVTGIADPEKAHDKIMGDPASQLEFEKATMNLELELYREDTKRLETVNATMRAEAESKSWAQRTWRPFNGFLYGITLFCDYFISQVIFMIIKAKYPLFSFTWEHIPPAVYMMWAAVLGVAAGTRGWEKVSIAKTQGGSQMGIAEMAKLF